MREREETTARSWPRQRVVESTRSAHRLETSLPLSASTSTSAQPHPICIAATTPEPPARYLVSVMRGRDRASFRWWKATALAVVLVAAVGVLAASRAPSGVVGVTPAKAATPPPADRPDPSVVTAPDATDARVSLGRAIFFDANLSSPPGTSCASCHDPARGSRAITAPSSAFRSAAGGSLREAQHAVRPLPALRPKISPALGRGCAAGRCVRRLLLGRPHRLVDGARRAAALEPR